MQNLAPGPQKPDMEAVQVRGWGWGPGHSGPCRSLTHCSQHRLLHPTMSSQNNWEEKVAFRKGQISPATPRPQVASVCPPQDPGVAPRGSQLTMEVLSYVMAWAWAGPRYYRCP